jgi:hypothetical protein
MRKPEYTRQRRQLEQERIAIADSLAKVDAKLAALDLVWNEIYMAGKGACDGAPEAVAAAPASPTSAETANNIAAPTQHADHIEDGQPAGREVVRNGQAQEIIDEIVAELAHEPTTFGVREIQGAIHRIYNDLTVNRTTIAGRLRKLADEGKIIVMAEAGAGRRPGKFRGRSAA